MDRENGRHDDRNFRVDRYCRHQAAGVPVTAPASLQDLLDHGAMTSLISDFAYGIDQRDWSRFRSVFTDEIWVDLSWVGVNEAMPADNWVISVSKSLAPCDATQHRMTNIDITLDGDRATLLTHMTARHMFELDGKKEFQTVGGYYHHDLVRTADGWRISKMKLVITWEEGDPNLFARAAERGPQARSDIGTQGMVWEAVDRALIENTAPNRPKP
jgi:hypothetical protein